MYSSTGGVGVRVGRGDSTIQGTVLKRFLQYCTRPRANKAHAWQSGGTSVCVSTILCGRPSSMRLNTA